MKLKIEEFEELAKRKGFQSGYRLWLHLDGGTFAYKLARNGVHLGYEFVKNLYNEMGSKETLAVIDFDKETFDGFKAKYIEVAGKLY